MPTKIAETTDLLDSKRAARVATTANITLSGTQTIDGVSVVVDDRVLVKNQTVGSENGVYVVASGAWFRALDVSDDTQVEEGIFLWVREGTANGSTAWYLETVALITLGTTPLVFRQFAASDATVPHGPDHENGGSDEINVAGLSGELADDQPPKSHTHAASEVTSGTFADARIAESNVTQHEAAIDHDALTNFDINKHRELDDSSNSTIELLSANKINTLISAVISGAAIKAGVDTSTEGLGDITLSGEQTLNGLLTSTSRVLVTEQTLSEENGIYDTAAGAWARAADSDGSPSNEVANGNITHVLNSGSTKFQNKYILVSPDPIVVGTDAQVWEEHRNVVFGTTSGTAAEGDDSRIPTQDENDALVGASGVPSSSNPVVLDSDSRNTNARTPTAHAASHENGGSDEINVAGLSGELADAQPPKSHAIAGADHSASTLAALNLKISDANVDDSGDSRTPSGVAGGDLGGTYPNPTVDDGADGSAIHDNVSAEINAITEKAVPVAADLIIIEDSGAGNTKKKVQLGNLPSGGSVTSDILISYATDNDPFVNKSLTTSYVAVDAFRFKGTTLGDTPNDVILTKQASTSSPLHSIRIFDSTNSLVIAEMTGLSSTTLDFLNMGTLSNIDADPAVWEIQMKRDTAGSVSVDLYSTEILF